MITVVDQGADGVAIVALFGEHDVSTAPALDARLAEVQREAAGLVIDLTGATFVDSSVIGTLLGAQRRAQERGAGFAIALRPDGFVRSVLEITRLQDALPAYDTRAAAITAARGVPARPAAPL